VPPGDCLWVKADMVLFAGNTVWSMSECVRGVRKDALYKSTLPLQWDKVRNKEVKHRTGMETLERARLQWLGHAQNGWHQNTKTCTDVVSRK